MRAENAPVALWTLTSLGTAPEWPAVLARRHTAMLQRILIALDETPSGAAAVEWALDHAERMGAEVIGLGIIPSP